MVSKALSLLLLTAQVIGQASDTTVEKVTNYVENTSTPDTTSPSSDDIASNSTQPTFELNLGNSIEYYLNDQYRDPKALRKISRDLKAKKLVVLKDAFLPAFAEAVHYEMYHKIEYDMNEGYNDDGFQFHHHNVYEPDTLSDFMKGVVALFETDETKDFAYRMTGRDTFGEPNPAAPSYYAPGDYSMPHSDHYGQRTVAYVWHLTDDWRPEWGGGLYWCQETWNSAFTPASYNTLFLFNVHFDTQHHVTHVSRHAEGKRLAFNGWWVSEWWPDLDYDSELVEYLSVREHRDNLTMDQHDTLMDWLLRIEENDEEEPEEFLGLTDKLRLIREESYRPSLFTKYYGFDDEEDAMGEADEL